MKRARILLSVMLSVAMILLFTACGKTANFFISMQEAASIKSYEYTTEITIDAKDILTTTNEQPSSDDETSDAQLKLKLSGTILENGDFSSDIFIGIDSSIDNDYIRMLQTDGDYLNFTDIIMKDDTIYINIKKLSNVLDAFGFTEYAAMFKYLGTEYIEFDLDMIEEYGISLQSDDLDKTAIAIQKIYFNFLNLMETTIKDIKPTLLSEKNGTYTFTLNKENFPAVIDNVIELIDGVTIEEFLNESIKEIESIDKEQVAELIEELKQAKEMVSSSEFKTEAKVQLFELKSKITENLDVFEIIGTSALKGGEGSRKWDFTISTNYEQNENEIQAINSLSLKFSHNITELSKDVEITAPNDFILFDELV